MINVGAKEKEEERKCMEHKETEGEISRYPGGQEGIHTGGQGVYKRRS